MTGAESEPELKLPGFCTLSVRDRFSKTPASEASTALRGASSKLPGAPSRARIGTPVWSSDAESVCHAWRVQRAHFVRRRQDCLRQFSRLLTSLVAHLLATTHQPPMEDSAGVTAAGLLAHRLGHHRPLRCYTQRREGCQPAELVRPPDSCSTPAREADERLPGSRRTAFRLRGIR
jgi:hypothetical protein